jgi:hypothetical protein
MQHADHAAARHQRRPHHRLNPPGPQDRVQHRGVINTVGDDLPGGAAPGESPAHWDQNALAHLLLEPGRRGRDQLLGGIIEQ